jgi:diamine N-acetyltransferase
MKVDLAEIGEEHADLIANWKSSKELSNQIMSSFKVTTVSEAKKWIKKTSESDSQKLFGIFTLENSTKKLVGISRLMYIDLKSGTSEFGIYIGEQKAQGRGIGKQALNLTLKYGFERLKLRKIYLRVNTNNHRAIQLYQNLSFEVEGVLKDHFLNDETYEDIQYMSLFQKNFKEGKK